MSDLRAQLFSDVMMTSEKVRPRLEGKTLHEVYKLLGQRALDLPSPRAGSLLYDALLEVSALASVCAFKLLERGDLEVTGGVN